MTQQSSYFALESVEGDIVHSYDFLLAVEDLPQVHDLHTFHLVWLLLEKEFVRERCGVACGGAGRVPAPVGGLQDISHVTSQQSQQSHREGEVPGLSNAILAGSDIVQVPQQDGEHQTGDQVAAPHVDQGHVVGADHRGGHIGPVHPPGAVRLSEPHHDEAEGETQVWNKGDGDLGAEAPSKITLRSDESTRQPGTKVEHDTQSYGQVSYKQRHS